jgi:hypothetical protein
VSKKKATMCPDCGGEMVRDVRKAAWTYRGNHLNYMQPGLYCIKCENCHLSDIDVTEVEDSMQAFRDKVDASLAPSLSPREIKLLRERHHPEINR